MDSLIDRLNAALDEDERIALAAKAMLDELYEQPAVPTGGYQGWVDMHEARKLLKEHPSRAEPVAYDQEQMICATCTYDSGTDTFDYPCPTILALAEMFGVEP